MIMAVRLSVSKISRSQRSEGSGHNAIDSNLLKMLLSTILLSTEHECVINGLSWWRFVLCECFLLVLLLSLLLLLLLLPK